MGGLSLSYKPAQVQKFGNPNMARTIVESEDGDSAVQHRDSILDGIDDDDDLDEEERLLQRTILRNFIARTKNTNLLNAKIESRVFEDSFDDA